MRSGRRTFRDISWVEESKNEVVATKKTKTVQSGGCDEKEKHVIGGKDRSGERLQC